MHNNEIDFLASVTHDLKSPLNVILCTIAMLKEDIAVGRVDKEMILSDLSNVEMSGKNMLEMINNLLTTARMKAGKEILSPTWISRSELKQRAISLENTFRNEARSKNIDFSVSVGELPNFVYWDIQRIRYFAINNLISNALKFIRQGGTLKVVINAENNNVVISVMDDGPGIPESERAGIFNKFIQAKNNPRSFQGGGFGLFNAYQTITMHQGKIEIEDGLHGKGVTFRVTMPVVPLGLETPIDIKTPYKPTRIKCPRLVQDNPNIQSVA